MSWTGDRADPEVVNMNRGIGNGCLATLASWISVYVIYKLVVLFMHWSIG